jgi:hypothetical protein
MSFELYVRTEKGDCLEWTRQQTECFAIAHAIFTAMKVHANFDGGPFVLVQKYKNALVEFYDYSAPGVRPLCGSVNRESKWLH